MTRGCPPEAGSGKVGASHRMSRRLRQLPHRPLLGASISTRLGVALSASRSRSPGRSPLETGNPSEVAGAATSRQAARKSALVARYLAFGLHPLARSAGAAR
jgi:hypothetical protein